jgi:hypothetical protein
MLVLPQEGPNASHQNRFKSEQAVDRDTPNRTRTWVEGDMMFPVFCVEIA